MDISLFDFPLPADAIAHHPTHPRDHARLLDVSMDVDKNSVLVDRHVYDLPQLLRAGDVLVFNDTKVFKARLSGKVGHATCSLLVHRLLPNDQGFALCKNARRVSVSSLIVLDGLDGAMFSARVLEKYPDGQVLLEFIWDLHQFSTLFDCFAYYGSTPIPPYIKRPLHTDDATDYQTVYATHYGAVAAPTAGLHFTDVLLSRLSSMGVHLVFATLHVGIGTFLPVKTQRIEDHVMHEEYGVLSPDSVKIINTARSLGGRVIAIGTTALRVLESASVVDGDIQPFSGMISLYISPGYRFKVVDWLMTNFHLPQSTLFILVSALMGLDTMQHAYAHALRSGYRFFSYGDATLLRGRMS